MNEQSLTNGLKIEVRLEQFYHAEMLREAKTEIDRQDEHMRHKTALENILDTYERKIKYLRELGMLERQVLHWK